MNKYKGEVAINIGGKTRALIFNMHSYAIASEGMKLSIDEYQKAISDHRQTRAFMWLIYAGLSTSLEMKGQEVDFTYFDVAEWLADVDQDEFDKVIKTIEAASQTNLPKEDSVVSDKKK